MQLFQLALCTEYWAQHSKSISACSLGVLESNIWTLKNETDNYS